MKTSDFNYELPPELIAQQPSDRRDGSRMMVVHRADGRLEHRRFSDLPGYLRSGDLLVWNNTRVIPARLIGHKEGTGGKIEFLMLEEKSPGVWEALLRAHRRPKVGSRIEITPQTSVILLEDGDMGRVILRIESARPFLDVLEEAGVPPLPPYIARKKVDPKQLAFDRERYQTIYAHTPGAVAAPTAGLHFTPEIVQTLEAQGIQRAGVTLHVGLGTFRPVSVENLEEHVMEAERYTVPEETAGLIQATKTQGGRVIAVGSTTVRTLETIAFEKGRIQAAEGRSALFIYPPFTFKVVDAMLTNFHLPQSTLLMMISALAGRDLILRAYREAVHEKSRFYSYGDCMLIL